MLTAVHPKLPMRDKARTRAYFVEQLGFVDVGAADYPDYLIVRLDQIELHFFAYPELDPLTNYGQVYIRTDAIVELHAGLVRRGVAIHPNGGLAHKPWGQLEFALLDPDHNLITFGQAI